jgi:hypothetical protein
LHERRQAAGEEVGADQKRHVLGRKLKRAAENKRHSDRAGIHDQHVLQAKCQKLWDRQKLIDRVNVVGHGPNPPLLIVKKRNSFRFNRLDLQLSGEA